jgi:hypothetical protein
MATATDSFERWLQQASLHAAPLNPQQRALLQATFRFRQNQGRLAIPGVEPVGGGWGSRIDYLDYC